MVVLTSPDLRRVPYFFMKFLCSKSSVCLLVGLFLYAPLPNCLTAELTVDLDVTTSPTPQVSIDCNSQGSLPVYIRKRALGDVGYETWLTIATYPDGSAPPFIDTNQVDGESYECRVDA